MTSTTTPPATTADLGPGDAPQRRTLVLLAVGYLLLFGVLIATGADNEPDASAESLFDAQKLSETAIHVTSYLGMVTCAVLVFFGAALRPHLRGRSRPWTADVAMLGFVVMALTLASWGVSASAMWQAAELEDPTIIRAMNLIDTSNFLPAMLAMMCAMVGAGLTALRCGSLPKWLAVASVVLGGLAPLGPAGFLPFVLFPLWMVALAATVRIADREQSA